MWLYLRFTPSFRDVEGLLAERGIIVSYETIRRRVDHFGPLIAADLCRRRCRPHSTRHLDEMVVSIGGRRMYLWRAAVYNPFNHCRHLTSARIHRHFRGEAMTEWREAAGMPA